MFDTSPCAANVGASVKGWWWWWLRAGSIQYRWYSIEWCDTGSGGTGANGVCMSVANEVEVGGEAVAKGMHDAAPYAGLPSRSSTRLRARIAAVTCAGAVSGQSFSHASPSPCGLTLALQTGCDAHDAAVAHRYVAAPPPRSRAATLRPHARRAQQQTSIS